MIDGTTIKFDNTKNEKTRHFNGYYINTKERKNVQTESQLFSMTLFSFDWYRIGNTLWLRAKGKWSATLIMAVSSDGLNTHPRTTCAIIGGCTVFRAVK